MRHITFTWAKTRLGLAVISLFFSLVMLAACGDTATSLPASSSSPTTGAAVSNRTTPTVARSTSQAVSSVATTTSGPVSLDGAVLALHTANSYHFKLDRLPYTDTNSNITPQVLYAEGDVSGDLLDPKQKIHYIVQDNTQYPPNSAHKMATGEYLEVYKKDAPFNHELYQKKDGGWKLVASPGSEDVYNMFVSTDYLNPIDFPSQPVAAGNEAIEGQDCARFDFPVKNNQKSVWINRSTGQLVRLEVKDAQNKGRWKPFNIVYSNFNQPVTLPDLTAAGSSGQTTLAPSGAPSATTASSAANPASTSNNSPCSLVTKAEAEAILGEAVKEPTEQYGGCTYYLVTPKPGTLASVPWMSVTRTQGTRDNFNSAVKAYEIAGPAKPESGLGDYAMSASGFLFILKGNNIISIQPGNTQISAQQVRSFALKALGRV